jgi:hypothetical protein
MVQVAVLLLDRYDSESSGNIDSPLNILVNYDWQCLPSNAALIETVEVH